MKKNIILTEEQLRKLKDKLKEDKHEHKSSKMSKQQLFTIATLTKKMWEVMSDDDTLEDWQESKIAQAEQSIIAVVKSFMYDEHMEKIKGVEGLNLDDMIIGH